ncbi:recombinase family protein [Archangium violaceum]|uniref:recombinase family protein n=1 Tax=Archangium violaceum TaxID=83451 RepID=UPI000696D6DE|nr:recombinase family protein [Archangium violaceum]
MSTDAKAPKVALYLRVSTEEQTLEQQERELRREAERRRWEVAGVYAEKASGATVKRAELARLRHDAALNRFSAVLVWDVARLGRDFLDAGFVARELFRRGVAVVSSTQPDLDLSTPHGQLVLNVWLSFAQYRRQEISRATRRRLKQLKDDGVKLGRRPKPVDPFEALAVLQECKGVKTQAARRLRVSVDTLDRRLAEAKRRRASTTPDAPAAGVEPQRLPS